MRRTALITGGSRGIGRACVQRLARAGWSVVFIYHHRHDLAQELTQQMRAEGLDVACVACDLADSRALQETLRGILETYRHIDLLVNNAAVSHIALLTDITPEQWRHMFAVCVDGAFYCAQAVLPGMIARRQGAIINISSMWGEVGASCEVSYSAAKAALIGMTKALAKEVGPSGVRVNCITPGVIATDMNASLDEETLEQLAEETPLGRLGTPDEVARAVEFLAGEGSAFITGQVLGVSGGLVI